MTMALRTVYICAALSWCKPCRASRSCRPDSDRMTSKMDDFPKEQFYMFTNSMSWQGFHTQSWGCDPFIHLPQHRLAENATEEMQMGDLDRQCRAVEKKGKWLWEADDLENGDAKKPGMTTRDQHPQLAPDDFEEVTLAQNGRGKTRSRSRSPRRRRTRRGNDRRDNRSERSRGRWEWQASQASSSYRKLPPWRTEPEEGWDDWTAGTSSGSGLRREAREMGS